jgi:hypothetical protein
MLRQTFRNIARRTPGYRFPSIRIRTMPPNTPPHSQKSMYANTADGEATKRQDNLNNSLRDMDIDFAEQHMNNVFGFRDSWDHEKLKSLAYGIPGLYQTLDCC